MKLPEPMIFVVDDEAAVLKALSRLLRSAGWAVTTFASPQEFLERHDRNAHGCVVLDMSMPGLSGLELQQALSADGTGLPIIFLTGKGDISMSVKAMKQGAVDFLIKPVEESVLLDAISAAVEQDRISWLARAEVAELQRKVASLTPREFEVFGHVVSGKLNKQTAHALGTGEQTVKVHRGRVMEKLGVESVQELVRLAERAGIPLRQ